MPTLWTLGYGRHTPDTFVATLRDAGIERVVDVRAAPVSRRPGFSKGPLERALREAGIAYESRKELGVTKSVRDHYRVGGDWASLAAWYDAHLAAVGPSVAAVALAATQERVCLVCMETEADTCHRSLLAARMARAGFDVVHL